jgi:hypothetical protein
MLIKTFTYEIIDFLRTYQFCDGSLYSIQNPNSAINPQQAIDVTRVALFTPILMSTPIFLTLPKGPLWMLIYIEHMDLCNLHPIVYNKA